MKCYECSRDIVRGIDLNPLESGSFESKVICFKCFDIDDDDTTPLQE